MELTVCHVLGIGMGLTFFVGCLVAGWITMSLDRPPQIKKEPELKSKFKVSLPPKKVVGSVGVGLTIAAAILIMMNTTVKDCGEDDSITRTLSPEMNTVVAEVTDCDCED